MRQHKPRSLFKVIFVIFGTIVGLLFGEAALRIISYSYPQFYQVDLLRGYSLSPGVEGWWYDKEGRSYVRINSDGLRDREHSLSKPLDTLRIAILGDSYAEALQVPVESAFWAVMQRQLASSCTNKGQKIEVINFGVSGYGTAQELITLRERVWKYNPDIVVLAFTTSNDITDNSRTLRKANEVPYFIHRNGKLELDDSFQDSSGFRLQHSWISPVGMWFRNHVRLIQAILEASRSLRLRLASFRSGAQSKQLPSKSKTDTLELSAERGLDNLVYTAPKSDDWKEAWSVTEELLKTMHDEVMGKGARFLVVTLTNGPQVVPSAETRLNFMKRFGVTDLFYPDNRIKDFGQREGFSVLTLAPTMQSYASENNVVLHGFAQNLGSGHWNADGHRIAGGLLAEKLCSNGWVK